MFVLVISIDITNLNGMSGTKDVFPQNTDNSQSN